MKRALLVLLSVALTLGVGVGCEKDDDADNDGGTTPEPSEVPDDIALARTFPPLLANGTDEITIYATVVDATGRGLEDVGVIFTTSEGTIEPFATTNSSGVAQSTLTSEASPTDLTAVVTATASTATSEGKTASPGAPSAGRAAPASAVVFVTNAPLSDSLYQTARVRRLDQATPMSVVLAGAEIISDEVQVPMTGITLAMTPNPATIPADGISESRIIASLSETTSGIPLAAEEVRFGVSGGSITGRVTTGDDGRATAILTADPGETSATVTAYYGHTLTTETAVQFSPLTLSLESEDAPLFAGAESSIEIVARLVTDQGNPVRGAEIRFTTDLGTITSPHTTNGQGEAAAVFRPGTETGQAHVVASFGSLEETLTVPVLEVPQTARILLSADPATLPADGMSEATVQAIALDGSGNPVVDNTPVTFSIVSGPGTILAPVQPTLDGVATATYVAATTAGNVTVGAASAEADTTTPLVLVQLEVGAIALTAENASILANGIASTEITAAVTDVFGHPVMRGTMVSFATSQGALTLDQVPTNEQGLASTWLRSMPFETGTARVTAEAAGSQSTVDVRFISEEAAHIEVVGVNPPNIGVRGAGDHETAVVTYQVQDRNGIPVDVANGVTLAFAIHPLAGATDATVYPATAQTNELGQAWTTVNAGAEAGAVSISATAEGLAGERVTVAIHGGRPDEEHFSIAFEQVNIAGLVYAGLEDAVTAYVGDENGNPVPFHTEVWFHAEYGLIQGSAGSATREWAAAGTDTLGRATVTEVTAAPYPQIPGGDGLVDICAQTVDATGERIEVCSQVMWSGQTIVEILEPAEGFVVPNGGSIDIEYLVRDANHNPLTEGTTITLTASGGELGGDVSVTLPDTQSSAYTMFDAVLMDDDVDTNEAERVTITITVESFNGNASESVTGTKY